jgi:hypothetical protein
MPIDDKAGIRVLRKCVACGERVPLSHATDDWESEHIEHEKDL